MSLSAAPTWKAPAKAAFGEMVVLELREDDPAAPPLPRPPVDQTFGPVRVRSVEATADGRGWKLVVQALTPGRQLLPALDLGDGRRSPEVRLEVPRTAPLGGLWMAIGGGATNDLPDVPFPWGWASLVLLPMAAVSALVLRRWHKGAAKRGRKRLAGRFVKAWPPRDAERATLDAAHALGRELLAAVHGESARGWGARDLRDRRLDLWAQWVEALDRARFTGERPAFPPALELVRGLGQEP